MSTELVAIERITIRKGDSNAWEMKSTPRLLLQSLGGVSSFLWSNIGKYSFPVYSNSDIAHMCELHTIEL